MSFSSWAQLANFVSKFGVCDKEFSQWQCPNHYSPIQVFVIYCLKWNLSLSKSSAVVNKYKDIEALEYIEYSQVLMSKSQYFINRIYLCHC